MAMSAQASGRNGHAQSCRLGLNHAPHSATTGAVDGARFCSQCMRHQVAVTCDITCHRRVQKNKMVIGLQRCTNDPIAR